MNYSLKVLNKAEVSDLHVLELHVNVMVGFPQVFVLFSQVKNIFCRRIKTEDIKKEHLVEQRVVSGDL